MDYSRDYCLTKISIRAKRSISRVFSLFIVPSPFSCTLPVQRPTSYPGPLVILLEMDRDSRSDPGGHRKVLPFDWLTEEQKIFVNYYDYAALIRSQLQRTLNCLKNREFTTRTGTARNSTVQLYCIKGAIKYIL